MTAITPSVVPFSSLSNLMTFVRYEEDAAEWRPNEPFHATLRLHDVKRSVSSARFTWKDEETGTLYPMLLPDMIDMVTATTISLGVTKGWWIVCQRGRNYGLRPARSGEEVIPAPPQTRSATGDMQCSMPRPHRAHDLTHADRVYRCDGVHVTLIRQPTEDPSTHVE